MRGSVMSIRTGALVVVATLAALSLTFAVAVCAAPSTAMVEALGTVAGSIPDNPSVSVQSISTGLVYQPAALGAVSGVPVRSGFVLSMLMWSTLAGVALPTLSTARPCTDWSASSSDTVVLAGEQAPTPDCVSAQL